MLAAALAALAHDGVRIEAASPVIDSDPLGPSRRRYANGAAVVRSGLEPRALLALVKRIEHGFGRRRGGLRWRARVLDLDLVLWSGGCWSDAALTIPHPRFRARRFVVVPAAAVAPAWRDPVTRLTLRQLRTRLTRASPLA